MDTRHSRSGTFARSIESEYFRHSVRSGAALDNENLAVEIRTAGGRSQLPYQRSMNARVLLVLYLVLAFPQASQAAERVKGVSLFTEPLTIEAVPGRLLHTLAVIPQPNVGSPVYALTGKIRYSDVEGDAYLQMNNDFGETGVFHTMAIAESGPMGRISGSSHWRAFVLPFYANRGELSGDGDLVPDELTLLLHLPAAGTVTIRDVKLYRYAADEDPLASVPQGFDFPNPQVRLALNVLIAVLFIAALFLFVFRRKGKSD